MTNQRNIIVSSTGIIITYGFASNTGVELDIPFPFFENDSNYTISDISVSSGGMSNGVVPTWDYMGLSSASIILNPNSDMSI